MDIININNIIKSQPINLKDLVTLMKVQHILNNQNTH